MIIDAALAAAAIVGAGLTLFGAFVLQGEVQLPPRYPTKTIAWAAIAIGTPLWAVKVLILLAQR